MTQELSLDWGSLVPLRLKARSVADGVYAGAHRSPRRGSGVEFGGHRSYVPGDDLRWLDRRALMRHGKLLVREFETETDRALRLVIDETASMAFRSKQAPGAKLAYAALVAAALARIALASGDPVALDWMTPDTNRSLPSMGGREAFDRIIGALEDARAQGELEGGVAAVDRVVAPVARYARRGSIVVLLSDLIDLPDGTADRIAALGTRGRTIVAVQVLDPIEATFPFDGPVRLRSTEGTSIVETDAGAARAGYLGALEALQHAWSERLTARGGRLVVASTTDDPVTVVREVVQAAQGRAA